MMMPGLLAVLAVLMCARGDAPGEARAGQADEEAIRQAIMDHYHEGHRQSDPRLYREILHETWKIFYFDENGALATADRDEYLSWYDPEKADGRLKWETRIDYVDVYRDIAAVKLWIGNQDFAYVDYFNLMRLDGRWWIVHKISQRAEPSRR